MSPTRQLPIVPAADLDAFTVDDVAALLYAAWARSEQARAPWGRDPVPADHTYPTWDEAGPAVRSTWRDRAYDLAHLAQRDTVSGHWLALAPRQGGVDYGSERRAVDGVGKLGDAFRRLALAPWCGGWRVTFDDDGRNARSVAAANTGGIGPPSAVLLVRSVGTRTGRWTAIARVTIPLG